MSKSIFYSADFQTFPIVAHYLTEMLRQRIDFNEQNTSLILNNVRHKNRVAGYKRA